MGSWVEKNINMASKIKNVSGLSNHRNCVLSYSKSVEYFPYLGYHLRNQALIDMGYVIGTF